MQIGLLSSSFFNLAPSILSFPMSIAAAKILLIPLDCEWVPEGGEISGTSEALSLTSENQPYLENWKQN